MNKTFVAGDVTLWQGGGGDLNIRVGGAVFLCRYLGRAMEELIRT